MERRSKMKVRARTTVRNVAILKAERRQSVAGGNQRGRPINWRVAEPRKAGSASADKLGLAKPVHPVPRNSRPFGADLTLILVTRVGSATVDSSEGESGCVSQVSFGPFSSA
jgi:hypothetical protein